MSDRTARLVTVLVAAVILGGATAAQAQIRNPRAVQFACPDHDQDTGHELDILDSTGKVIQTLELGDPAASGTGTLPDGTPAPLVTATINVQPVAFGTYTAVVRAVFGTAKSDPSQPSDPWVRAPGRPDKPTLSATVPTARVAK
jgi:hypothetical protein